MPGVSTQLELHPSEIASESTLENRRHRCACACKDVHDLRHVADVEKQLQQQPLHAQPNEQQQLS